jgi:hypothetical protein
MGVVLIVKDLDRLSGTLIGHERHSDLRGIT